MFDEASRFCDQCSRISTSLLHISWTVPPLPPYVPMLRKRSENCCSSCIFFLLLLLQKPECENFKTSTIQAFSAFSGLSYVTWRATKQARLLSIFMFAFSAKDVSMLLGKIVFVCGYLIFLQQFGLKCFRKPTSRKTHCKYMLYINIFL